MNRILSLAVFLTVSLNASAFGLPEVEVPSVNTDAKNMVAALKVIQDGGIQCEAITNFKVSSNVKGYQVECDKKNQYTLLDTNDGLVIQVK